MKNNKMIIIFVGLLVLLVAPIVSLANTIYIQTVTITYSVASLKTATSDAVDYNYDNVRYVASWSKVTTDMTSGYYTQFTLQKKSTLVYKNVDVITVNNPTTNMSFTRSIDDVGTGTCRFKIYNYSVDTTGKISVNISNQSYT